MHDWSIGDGPSPPCRRSSEWLATKAILHLELVAAEGASHGSLLYKVIMLRALVALGSAYLRNSGSSDMSDDMSDDMDRSSGSVADGNGGITAAERADCGMQALAKVAIRARKLQALLSDAAAMPSDILDTAAAATAVHEAAQWVVSTRARLQTAWDSETLSRPGTAVIDPQRLSLLAHTRHRLPSSLNSIHGALWGSALAIAGYMQSATLAIAPPSTPARLLRSATMWACCRRHRGRGNP